MGEHALFAPSSMYRIIACPASVRDNMVAPHPTNPYAEHGTKLHDVVSKLLTRGKAGMPVEYDKLEEEDQQYVMSCIDYYTMILATCGTGTEIGIERRVDLRTWGIEDVFGTTDVSIHDVDAGVVHIIDWKFGSGVIVHANENEQAMCYAAGTIGYPYDGIKEITIHIYQPPVDHIDTWTITPQVLEEFLNDKVKPAIKEARSSNPSYGPSEKACRFCDAASYSLDDGTMHVCNARYERAQAVAKQVFAAYSSLPQISREDIGRTLKELKELETYAKQLRMFAEAEILHGRGIPGWKLVSGRSHRKWTDEATAVEFLEELPEMTAEKMWTSKLISPAQAEKINRKLKKDELFQALITKPPGKPQLASEDDKRPALTPDAEAWKAFEGYTEDFEE